VSELKPPPALPRPVLHAISRTKAWFLALSRPARVLLTSTVALALLFGLAVTYEKASEPWAPLFSQLDREDASTIVAKLKEMKIPYRVEADGTTVEVPESKARELRLELAGAGLPRGGGVGFESFDKMRLGATEFEQRVLYRRALEGELARTIGTLAAVESARVHLVLPERSVFVSRSEPASASIVLRLRQGRVLGPSEVAGVVHLVASAVPGLEADRVALVTTEGTMLHRPRGAAGADSEAAGDEPDAHMAARTYETALEDRVRTMLERVVGPGHADVRVTADLDPSRVERLEEHFDPTRSSLRSEEQSIERASGEADDTVAGVPGAESNLPGGAARGSSAAASASASSSGAPESPSPAVRESHTRNYEIDHVTEKRTTVSGALRRLTIAVMLDGTKSDQGVVERPRAELDRLAQLVRSAAGASEVRGDMVTVESMPFARPETPDLVEPPVAPRSPTKLDLAKRWGPYAAAALFALVLLVVVMRRRTPAVAPALADSQLAAGETAASHLPGVPAAPQLEPAPVAALDMGDLRARAHSRAGEDPATAALVLRSWLGTTVPEASAAPRS
jgi:flagellar M-ring protein FliF